MPKEYANPPPSDPGPPKTDLALRPMARTDIEAAACLVGAAMNADEGAQARETLDFHFACKRHGMDDGRSYYVLPGKTGLRGISGLHRYLWGPPQNVWLAWFAVAPHLRGTGLGKTLLDGIVSRATAFGYEKLFIETYSTPEFSSARAFYEAKGFRRAGGVDAYLPGGGDMVVYLKELTPHV